MLSSLAVVNSSRATQRCLQLNSEQACEWSTININS